jgi:hypothetical protein
VDCWQRAWVATVERIPRWERRSHGCVRGERCARTASGARAERGAIWWRKSQEDGGVAHSAVSELG